MHLSMVSPVYNEAKAIVDFVDRSAAVLARLSDTFEMILVNDCSTDSTLSLLQELKEKHPQLRVVNLSRNVGQQAATFLGLQQAKGDMVFLLDSDLQIHPEDMVKLYEFGRTQDDWEVISGSRTSRSQGFLRSLGSRAVTRIVNHLAGTKLEDPASTFLLIRQEVLRKACKNDVLAQNFSLLLGYMRLAIRQVPIDFHPNKTRKSGYSMTKLMEVLLLALLNYSTGRKTMLSLMLTGLFSLVAGTLLTLAIIMAGMIEQVPLRTNLLIFSLSLIIIGMQFLFLGVIAYKIETLNRNLDFRQTLTCTHDE